jgi:signal transduction histidine kinase
VAHAQIRTPLNAVGGATALLADTPLNDEQRELVALLNAGTSHVVSIIEGARPLSRPFVLPPLALLIDVARRSRAHADILQHGSLVSGAFQVARERLQLVQVVLDPASRMVQMQHSQRTKIASLRLTRIIASDVPPVIIGDGTRLVQVLTNLLSNAGAWLQRAGAV